MAAAPAPQIKGNVLASRLEYLRAKGGETAAEAVLARLPAADQEILRGWILPISWYPLELNLRLDEAIAVVLSPHDRTRVFLDMGRASADASLAGPQRPYVKAGDPHFLLRSAPQIYAAYYRVGRRTYEQTGEGSGVLRTFEAESVTPSDCLTVAGWHERAIELSGGKDVRVVERRCRARGDPHCEYACEWTMR
jgi:uncharacterized protein (TIGR02265 family)